MDPNGALPPALGREGFDLGYGARGGQMPLGPFGGISSRRLLRRAVAVEARASPSTTASRSIPTGITIPLRSLWQPPPYSYSYPMAEQCSVPFVDGPVR